MIKSITRDEILNGIGHQIACCMFDVNSRQFQCNMWLQIFDEVGSIGYLSYERDKPSGQMIFLPKKYARKIGLTTCRTNERLDTTLLIGCLLINKDYRNRGLATEMISAVIDFCKLKRYNRIEVGACNMPSGKELFESISYLPFKKFGFVIDASAPANEFSQRDRMCYLNLEDNG